MTRLRLSACLASNAVTRPILSGRIVPEGISWHVSALHPSEMFWRQLKFGDFDISEMSLASLTIAAARGLRAWTPLPVFTTRRFFHTGILVRRGSGIERPEDLAGKRVGVPEYQQTAAVWARGALAHEWGVLPGQLRWFMERPPGRSHGGATGFSPPADLELHYIDPGSSIADMLSTDELDAALVYLSDRNLVDRSRGAASKLGGVTTLFPDPDAEGRRYFAKTGLLPANHVVVVRAELLRRHPWVALNVFAAFTEAKRLAFADLSQRSAEIASAGGLLEPWVQIGAVPQSVLDTIRQVDPLPYGLRGQQPVLRALGLYLAEQGLTTSTIDIEDLFAPTTLDL